MQALILCLALSSFAGTPAGKLKDFTDVDPKSLGVVLVEPMKDDATGFIVGGKNPTDALAKLTSIADRSIKDLERDMRPGATSRLGFLGKDESLLEILAEDNRYVVDKLGLSHQLLAKHLHVVGAIAQKHGVENPYEFLYHGRKFRAAAQIFKAKVPSPFDDGTQTNCAVTITNVDANKTIPYSLLVPAMIERYGFYEGRGTPYRLPPEAVLDVFDFLKTK